MEKRSMTKIEAIKAYFGGGCREVTNEEMKGLVKYPGAMQELAEGAAKELGVELKTASA